jgi:ferredoxin-thioredoxin reductase catalytic subunit
MYDVDTLYAKLKELQEPRGLYFNKDEALVRDLLNSLLINRQRYGYMACPCRLASGVYEMDKDILCPCTYAWPDIREYGSCYCGLYVSPEWNEGTIDHVHVPERRPPEKLLAALQAAG